MSAARKTKRSSASQLHLGQRQEAILQFIYRYTQEQGHAPAVRDIGRGVGMTSTSNVMYHLNRLAEKGCLSKGQGTSRTIVLLEAGYQQISVPSTKTTHTKINALQRENRQLRAWCRRLQAMAADPDMQRELEHIQAEFALAEGDSLAEG